MFHAFESSAVREIQSNVSVDENADRLDGRTSKRQNLRILQPMEQSSLEKSSGESQKATQATLGTAHGVRPVGEKISMSASCEDWGWPSLVDVELQPRDKDTTFPSA